MRAHPLAHGVVAATPGADDCPATLRPQPCRTPSLQGLTREQKRALLHEELIKLNAQLEYLRLMLKLRPPRKG